MDIGKAPEGQKIAKVGTFGTPYNICGPCHHTRNHEMRLKFFQERGGDDEWFFPQHTISIQDRFQLKKVMLQNRCQKFTEEFRLILYKKL